VLFTQELTSDLSLFWAHFRPNMRAPWKTHTSRMCSWAPVIFPCGFLDTGGRPDCEEYRVQWCREGQAFAIVFSSTSRHSFNSIGRIVKDIDQTRDAGYPLALVATKTDLDREQEVSFDEGQHRAQELGAQYFHISAKDFRKAEEVFKHLACSLQCPETDLWQPRHKTSRDGNTGLTTVAPATARQWLPQWPSSLLGSCMGWKRKTVKSSKVTDRAC
jgi:GTPase SAR1 family protein